MRFSLEDIQRFAAWSADRNPLHVDAEFARRTYFGQPIAHGMLSVLGALANVDTAFPDAPLGLDIEFKGAVRPDVSHDVENTADEQSVRIVVRSPDSPVLAIRLERGAGLSSTSTEMLGGQHPLETASALRTTPAERDDDELATTLELHGVYSTADVPAEYFGSRIPDPGSRIPALHARVLALCSYLVGMEVPGLKSLFTRASLQFAQAVDDCSTLVYRARTTRFDRAFRMLETRVDVATPDGRMVASGTLRSYVRFGPVTSDPSELAARLTAPAKALAGSVALVIGGTRGLGADVTTALAVAGCRVYASFNRDRDAAADFERRLAENGLRATLLQGDAGDAEWCRSALEQVRRECGRLDLLILNACATPTVLRAGPPAAERSSSYVVDNLRLVQVPLAECLPAIQESGGAIAYISSSFVDEPPAGFGPYVAVKQAAEGLLRAASRESGAFDTLIVRPPRLRTSWNDTPTGVPGTIPADWVASHVVNRLGECRGSRRVEMLTAFEPFARASTSTPGPRSSMWRDPTETQSTIAVAVAGSFTVDPILPALRFWLSELQIAGDIEVAPYGQVVQTLLDPGSVFASPRRGLNLVLLRVGDWVRELSSTDDSRRVLQSATSDFERAMRAHRARGGSPTILMICPSSAVSSDVDPLIGQTEEAVAASVNGLPGLQVVHAGTFHGRYGVSEADVHDPLRDRIGHIPYRDEYFHVLATVAMRNAYRRMAPARKVVVVDADNTLWHGVVGEVGAEGISFDAGHRALHRALVRLAQSGVLIAICSKNEESDVWEVFDTRADFELRREHIVSAAINWERKSQNLRALASRLNLGLDSLIFVDDNPVECAEVRANCPEVLTLQWPQDSEAAISLLEHTWELDAVHATAEDRRRTEMYREELQRQELREGTLTLREFLDSLDLHVEIATLTPEDLRRASQLTLRTNQFNFTTRRLDEAEMQALASGGRHDIRTVRVRDRFGDYGLVGLIVGEWRDDRLDADTFLLSCRVLGRGVEHRMAAELGRMAQARGVGVVSLRVDFTKKNTPARQFLQAIAPAGQLSAAEDSLECRMSSAELVGLRFEPSEESSGAAPEGDEDQAPAATPPVQSSHLRAREEQILRTASELSTAHDLASAIAPHAGDVHVGRTFQVRQASPTGLAPREGAPQTRDVAEKVYGTFADALRVPAARVKELDRLEALGCDSLKIVEITVELIDAFPWVPPTLLFEHRTVSEIARAISALREPVDKSSDVDRPVGRALLGSPGEPDRVRPTSDDIAIIGMHVRCAGANSPGELWELLSAGRSAVDAVPANRRHFLHPLADTRPHWAGLLDEVGRFDAEFFGVSPREAEYMDPQLRLFLEVAWGALEDAGCVGADHDSETGVFAGVMYADYGARANIGSTGAANPYRCWEGFSLANRLSQLLGFSGPSLAIDTACSSSGTALHLACASLKAGECRVAVVGGVNLILDPDRFASLGRLGILSTRGRCEPFGADADGTVLGEGAGVVILRSLDEALRRGDRIYGVIKGTGLSTGSGTVGFTAPNPQAQAEAIRRSLGAARVDPRTISYVEAHGTGTALGDPIEVRGLTLAYGRQDLHDSALTLEHRCRLGSIKPNIGHLEAGAGVLGLIKVLLQFQHRMLLPSITSSQPNPQIPFAQGPFDVQRELAEWQQPVADVNGKSMAVPRRAGLSSFGVGGANAHVIVEEPPAASAPSASVERSVHVLAMSARNDASLQQHAGRLLQQLDRGPDAAVADVCYSAGSGHKHFEHRVALPVATRDELQRALHEIGRGAVPKGGARGVSSSGSSPKIAFLFTGQGSQYVGMGRQLYDTHPVFREAIDRSAAMLDARLNRPLLDILFASDGSPDAELVNQTAYTQPALFAFEYAMSQLWLSWGIRPDLVLGHSIGEIAAMCVAGGVSLEDGLTLVEARGRLMQALPPGGVMTSVMADEARVREAIGGWEESVAIAAINTTGQVVISGAGAAVAEITARLDAEGVKTKALVVSHAFHSPLMRPMLAEYERVVRQIAFAPPTTRFVSCVTPDPGELPDEVTGAEYWLRNVIDPVRFADAMRALEAEHVDVCIEVGPHPVLLGMARQCVADDSTVEWLPSLRRDADGWQTLLGSAARLYVRGGSIDWKGFDAPYSRKRVTVPTYAFTGKEYWLKDLPRSVRTGASDSEKRLDVQERQRKPDFYEVAWRRAEAEAAGASPGHWVILADQRGVGAELTDVLHERGVQTTLVAAGGRFEATGTRSYTIDPSSPEDFARLWDAVGADAASPPKVVHLWGLDAPPGGSLDVAALDRAIDRGVTSAVHVVRALADAAVSHPALWIVTQGAVSIDSVGRAFTARQAGLAIAQAPVWGLGRTIALEHPELWGGLIDIAHMDPRAAARVLAAELMCAEGVVSGFLVRRSAGEGGSRTGEDQVALTESGRYVARLVRAAAVAAGDSRQPIVRPDGAYLVTGGVGSLGLHVARWLVASGARHIVLVSRRAAVDRSVGAAIEVLERTGAVVSVVPADVSQPDDVDALLARIAAGPARLRGIVHAAGVDTTIPLSAMTSADIDAALAAKVRGGWLLHERTRASDLDLFVCFSSLASVLGSQHRGHYAAANAFLDALAAERRRLGLAATTVNWGPWSGGGMAGAAQLQQFERIGNRGLGPDEALNALDSIVSARIPQVVVADIDWEIFGPIYEARRARPILSEIPVGRASELDHLVGRATAPHRAGAVGTPPGGSPAPHDSAEWIETLQRLPLPQRESELALLLQREVAETLGFDTPASVALDRNFYEMGMDSLMMADLVGRLKKRVGISCSALVFDHPDVRSLAGKLIDRLPLDASDDMAGKKSTDVGQTSADEVHFADVGRVPRPAAHSGRGPASVAVLEERADAVGRVPLPGYDAPAESEIFAFQAQAFPERQIELVPPRWRWMFIDSARRLEVEPRVWFHRDGGRIVGQMGSIPVRLKVGDDERQTGWLVETMVLKEYRGHAVGSRLMVEAHEEQPFSLSLGQTAEMREIQFRLGWKQVAPLQTAQLLVRPANVLKGKLPRPAAIAAGLGIRASATLRDLLSERRQFEARIIDRFDERHDRLWAAASRDVTCAVVRDASYLNWKYVDQPGQQFLRLELRDGDDLKGVAVWMFRNADGIYRYRRAFLVDLVASLSDAPTLRQVIRAACAAAAAGEADALICHHIDARLTDALRDCAFHLRKPERFLLVDPGPLSGQARDHVLSAANWFVTQGDSDIDRPW